jgi:diguanylate cyclase (GGDEF)-like protein
MVCCKLVENTSGQEAMEMFDHFKRLNDAFGHDAGDIVLKKFAAILQDNCRRSNMCARIDGEEFLIVLTHTDVQGAVIAVERIRETLATQVFRFGTRDIFVTASFGIASLDRQSENFIQLMIRHAYVRTEWRNRGIGAQLLQA